MAGIHETEDDYGRIHAQSRLERDLAMTNTGVRGRVAEDEAENSNNGRCYGSEWAQPGCNACHCLRTRYIWTSISGAAYFGVAEWDAG